MAAHGDRMTKDQTTEREEKAIARVVRARVKAPRSAILAWVRAIGPDLILSGSLRDIRACARAF